jgi:hypothetical protein
MRRALGFVLCTSLLMFVLASATSAAVHVRVAIDPQTIPQCSQAHFFFGVANDGAEPIGVAIAISLVHGDRVVAGPFTGRTRLAAGERRTREFDITIGPLPLGNYAFVARARATDGSTDEAAAPFEVVAATPPSPCAGPAPADAATSLLRDVLQGAGFEAPTATEPKPWGIVKEIYR